MENQAVFLKSIKPLAIEEFLDFYFYRRLAHRLVPWLVKWRLSPNQITTLSLMFGLVAAYLALKQFFVAATCAAFVAILLDCCDGQVARLTGKVSPLGRSMDGVCDMIWVSALWWCIFFSDYFIERGYAIFWFMFFSATSMMVHCWHFDGVKVRYLELVDPAALEGDLDVASALSLARSKIRSWNLLEAVLALCIAFQAYFFVWGWKKKESCELSPEQRQLARKILEPVIEKWSWLGEGHHNTLVLLGMLVAPVTSHGLITAFFVILVPMNLWWLVCEYQFYRGFCAVKRQISA